MASGGTRQAVTEETKAEEVPANTSSASTQGPFVQWTGGNAGIATERVILKSHWNQLGITGDNVSFDVKNGMRLPESTLNQEQLDYLYKVDGFFVKTDSEGNPYKGGE